MIPIVTLTVACVRNFNDVRSQRIDIPEYFKRVGIDTVFRSAGAAAVGGALGYAGLALGGPLGAAAATMVGAIIGRAVARPFTGHSTSQACKARVN